MRACLDASAGAHAGAWLLLATLLSQQGKRVEAQGALSAGVACGTTAWAGALLRAQAQLFVADGTLGKAQASVQQAIQSGLTPECIAQVLSRTQSLTSSCIVDLQLNLCFDLPLNKHGSGSLDVCAHVPLDQTTLSQPDMPTALQRS